MKMLYHMGCCNFHSFDVCLCYVVKTVCWTKLLICEAKQLSFFVKALETIYLLFKSIDSLNKTIECPSKTIGLLIKTFGLPSRTTALFRKQLETIYFCIAKPLNCKATPLISQTESWICYEAKYLIC